MKKIFANGVDEVAFLNDLKREAVRLIKGYRGCKRYYRGR